MNADDQLIERLRGSMRAATGDMLPPHDLLEGISPSAVGRFRRPSSGAVLAAVSTVATIAVALLAVIVLGGRRTATSPAFAPTTPAGGATSLSVLRSELAILRRPQAARDRIPGWGIAAEERQNCSNCLNVVNVMRGQTRLVATIRVPHRDGPSPEHIYLVLGRVTTNWGTQGHVPGSVGDILYSGWRQRAPALGALHLSLVGFTRRQPHLQQPADELLNPVKIPMPVEALTPRSVILTSFATVGLVPDGVTRVKWELANPTQKTPATVNPRVHGNVATAPWTPAPASTRLLNEQYLVGATWYASDGHVVASFGVSMAQVNRASSH